jgi:alpha,alpha-trehalase
MWADGKTPRTSRRLIGRVLWPALLPIAFASASVAASAPGAGDPPQALFKDLFIAVQSAQIYADSKAFPDAVPKEAPEEILRQYHAEAPASPLELERFVEAHFTLPAPRPAESLWSRTSTAYGTP